jgi:uncharacterized Tic20 family protein
MSKKELTPEEQNEANLANWQTKLMPWMILMPTALVGVFIVLATMRVNEFEKYMYQGGESVIDRVLPNPNKTIIDSAIGEKMEYIKLYTYSKMEEHSINLRYNQAAVSIMSGIYTKYLGFFTGMILAIVGAVFIISKLKEDSSELDATLQEKMKLRLVSSSPGIIFGVLGTALMMITVIKKTEVKVTDMPLYLNHYNIPLTGASSEINFNPFEKPTIAPQEAQESKP